MDYRRSILHGHTLTIELSALSAHHIEQNAVTRLIIRRFVLAPVLSTQSPGVTIVLNVSPLWSSPVLGIEAHEVDSDLWIQFLVGLQLSGYLQHHGYAAGAIVGSHDRLAPVGTVGIIVSPGTTVPMGTQKDTCGRLRIVMGYDIGVLEYSTVVALKIGFLGFHLTAELTELADDPFATTLVRFAVHGTRTELALRVTIGESGVGIEGWTHGIEFLGLFHLLHVGRHTMAIGIGVSPGSNGCRSNKAQYDFHLFCHRLIFSSLTTFYFLHSSLNALLYLLHDTKPVAAPYLGNICLAVLAAQQLLGEKNEL